MYWPWDMIAVCLFNLKDHRMKKVQSIDDYIKDFPKPVQALLHTMRKTIQQAAPDATEKISYGMPTFYEAGNLVYFAAYARHIGFYPSSSGIKAFAQEFKNYKFSKGAVQFPLDKPLPLALIKRIVRYRVKENHAWALAKEKKKQVRICKQGHTFYKSSDCPVCPICAKEAQQNLFMADKLSAPAVRALSNKKIHNLQHLAKYTEAEIRALHGIGPSALSILKKALLAQRSSFKRNANQ